MLPMMIALLTDAMSIPLVCGAIAQDVAALLRHAAPLGYSVAALTRIAFRSLSAILVRLNEIAHCRSLRRSLRRSRRRKQRCEQK